MRAEEGASRSISRVLSRGEAVTIIPLGRSSPNASSNLPGSPRGPRFTARSGLLPYLVLLRMGFTLPPALTGAVRSYRTISPLPSTLRPLAVYFLWHFPWARAPQALPGILSCGARTFLQSAPGVRSSDRLTDSPTRVSPAGHRKES